MVRTKAFNSFQNKTNPMRAKLYIYPYRIKERKPHPILWSFDKEALEEISRRFKNKSLFEVEIEEKIITLKLIDVNNTRP